MQDLRDTEDEESKNTHTHTHKTLSTNKQTKKEEDFLCYFILYPFIKSPYQKQRVPFFMIVSKKKEIFNLCVVDDGMMVQSG